jgi:hypothetical protein
MRSLAVLISEQEKDAEHGEKREEMRPIDLLLPADGGGENRTFQPCPQTRSCVAAQSIVVSHTRRGTVLSHLSCPPLIITHGQPPVDGGTCAVCHVS